MSTTRVQVSFPEGPNDGPVDGLKTVTIMLDGTPWYEQTFARRDGLRLNVSIQSDYLSVRIDPEPPDYD
jgi:hypothetical protein